MTETDPVAHRGAAVPGPQKVAEPLSKQRLRLWLKLLKVTRLVEHEVRDRFRTAHDTTLPRFDVLAALHRAEAGLRMSELSGVLRVSNGNVTGIVERLVEEGHVMRAAVEGDRRATRVRLTAAGRIHFAQLASAHESWVDDLLDGVDAESARLMLEHLDHITEKLENEEASHERR